MQLMYSDTAGGRLAVHDLGGEGRTLVFLHGLGGSGSLEYPAVAGHSALCGYRRILFDWPGHGVSEAPEGFDYTTSSMARVALALLDQLCPGESITVFGHSMGGAIAIELAELLADRCALLILAEANTRAEGGIFSAKVAQWPVADYVAEGHRRMLSGDPCAVLIWGIADPAAVHRCATSLVTGVAPEWFDRVAALDIPRAAIFSDTHAAHPEAGRLSETGVPIHILPDSGHGMALDNPAGLAALIARIMAKDLSS